NQLSHTGTRLASRVPQSFRNRATPSGARTAPRQRITPVCLCFTAYQPVVRKPSEGDRDGCFPWHKLARILLGFQKRSRSFATQNTENSLYLDRYGLRPNRSAASSRKVEAAAPIALCFSS